jgi:hypothetical protein
MGLRDKYAWAISQAKGKFDGRRRNATESSTGPVP